MNDRVGELHRKSASTPSKSPPPLKDDGSGRNNSARWRIMWGGATVAIGALFVIWRFVPPGYLPDSLTYAIVVGRLEGVSQAEATKESLAAMAAAEKAKAEAQAPVNVAAQVAIASQSAPIEVAKNEEIARRQSVIEMIKTCQQTMRQAAGQAYAQCIAGGFQTGAECDANRGIVLEKLPDCGDLSNPIGTATPGATGE